MVVSGYSNLCSSKFSRRVPKVSSLTAEVPQYVNASLIRWTERIMNFEEINTVWFKSLTKRFLKNRRRTNFLEDVQTIPRSDTRFIFSKFSFNSRFLRDTKISIIVTLTKNCITIIVSIYTLSDLGNLSNLICSASRTIQQCSPPSEWITCELGVFPNFLENDLLKVDKIPGLTFFKAIRKRLRRIQNGFFPVTVAEFYARWTVYNSRLFA